MTLQIVLATDILTVQFLVNSKGKGSQLLVSLNSEATDFFGIIHTFEFQPCRKHNVSIMKNFFNYLYADTRHSFSHVDGTSTLPGQNAEVLNAKAYGTFIF